MNLNHQKMKQLPQILFKKSLVLFGLIACISYGQKETKTYSENFKVGNDAIIDINTNRADIEFKTWDKNEVSIETVIELEGASKEEAADYFNSDPVEVLGNSKRIEIRTNNGPNTFSWDIDYNTNFDFVIPEISDIGEILEGTVEVLDAIVIPDLPPLPPIPHFNFNYSRYQEEGDAYLEEWKEEFNENFDDDYRKQLKKWGEQVKKEAKKADAVRIQSDEVRKQVLAERKAIRGKVKAAREKSKRLAKANKEVYKVKGNGPSIFYYSGDSKEGNFKIKKTIKIKMPKSAKLKMNVRHGEVKLAENTNNINATLAYARLLGATIDGDRTFIKASYSPVSVQKWNYGKLAIDYSDAVRLEEVKNLRLNAVSSEITIDRLVNDIYLESTLGNVSINDISGNFKDIHLTIKNGDLNCQLPNSDYNVFITDEHSNVNYPVYLTMNTDGTTAARFHTGYNRQNNKDRVIVIDSKFSKIVLE